MLLSIIVYIQFKDGFIIADHSFLERATWDALFGTGHRAMKMGRYANE
jgi:hypothetical protein